MKRFYTQQKIQNTVIIFFSFLFISWSTTAQIGPPGMGNVNTGSWFAIGIKQNLDTVDKWTSTTYLGLARKSDPNNYNPLLNQSHFVINEEVNNRFHEHWEYSLGLSYRLQNLYQSAPPYEKGDPKSKHEFRVYGKFTYLIKTSFIDIAPTLRQEVRKFYTPRFKNYSENMQFRTRFRLKFALPLSENKVHRLLLYSEQLFAISLKEQPKRWTNFKYKDSRFSLFYSLNPKGVPLQFDLGYMHNLVGTKSTYSAHYFAFDIIWKNPF